MSEGLDENVAGNIITAVQLCFTFPYDIRTLPESCPIYFNFSSVFIPRTVKK